MEKIKKMASFFALFACFIGSVGGTLLAVKIGETPIALCIVVVSAFAWPTFKAMFKFLKS